jgi:putative DNA primase/helicase
LRRFIQQAVGYSLVGSVREQVFLICHGSGANGKSTFLNTLQACIGPDYASQADPASFMVGREGQIRNDLADFRGIRFLAAIETGDGRRIDEALVKSMTGGEQIRTRRLYHEAFQFKPEFTLWMATNHKPRIVGNDNAIWRRVCLVPFTVTVPEDERDRDLESRLLVEATGILSWAVQGTIDYLNNGLQRPDEVRAATEDYRKAEDILGQFIE